MKRKATTPLRVTLTLATLLLSSPCLALSWETLKKEIDTSLASVKYSGKHSVETEYNSSDNQLELNGYVASALDKQSVEDSLRTIKGVHSIKNNLVVQTTTGSTGGENSKDGEIQKKVNESLAGLRGTGIDYEISTGVKDGVITVRGEVGSPQDRQKVKDALLRVPEAASINDQITIKTISDEQVHKNVEKALNESKLDLSNVSYTVTNGVVTVRGQKPDHYIADHILTIVNMVEGVKDVRGEIQYPKSDY